MQAKISNVTSEITKHLLEMNALEPIARQFDPVRFNAVNALTCQTLHASDNKHSEMIY